MRPFLLFLCTILVSCSNNEHEPFNVFLSSRNKYENIYKYSFGDDVISQVIEDTTTDDCLIVSVKDKSELRYFVTVANFLSDEICVDGWIDKSSCAVYVRPRSETWEVYKYPSIIAPKIKFDSKEAEENIPLLYLLDYLKPKRYLKWVKVGFVYNGESYAGWTKDFCRDINHSCN